jgi:hypothetical protein
VQQWPTHPGGGAKTGTAVNEGEGCIGVEEISGAPTNAFASAHFRDAALMGIAVLTACSDSDA